MSVLILRLKGPQQSWGTSSRYRTREAGTEPSKSGVIGLLAAAQGRSRASELTDLLELGFGVRADQPGRLMVDYHTARVRGAKNSSLSSRHYRVDAAYTAAISGPDSLVAALAEAIDSPRFPLYLGGGRAPPRWICWAGCSRATTSRQPSGTSTPLHGWPPIGTAGKRRRSSICHWPGTPVLTKLAKRFRTCP